MNKNLEKLVDLRVKLSLAEKRYEDETDETELTNLEAEITEAKNEIDVLESELNKEEVVEETPIEEPIEENAPEIVEEPVEEVQEDVSEENEPTSEEVERSSQWRKVDEGNLKEVANYELRGGNRMKEDRKVLSKEELELRAKNLIEGRSVTVASDNILLPEHQSSDLATAPFKQYSSLIDLVKKRTLIGGKSYEAPFVKSYGTAGITDEEGNYTETEPVFDNVKISEVKVTAYTEISEELEKLPSADYVAEIEKNIKESVNKKLAQQVIAGTGSDQLVGILSTAAANKCVLTTDDLTISTIDGDTLDEIVFRYGGDEEVEGIATLMLNKLDLLAFSKVRNATNGLREYKINYADQTINGIPYVINSNIPSLSSASAGDYVMAYGVPMHYELTAFSNVETAKSYDYKFKTGQICFKSVGFFGGNTSSYRGFIRVKKGTVSA